MKQTTITLPELLVKVFLVVFFLVVTGAIAGFIVTIGGTVGVFQYVFGVLAGMVLILAEWAITTKAL